MNNTKTMLSDREQNRTDFNDGFLKDLTRQINGEHDPRNWVGLYSGFSMGRAYEIHDRRMFHNA